MKNKRLLLVTENRPKMMVGDSSFFYLFQSNDQWNGNPCLYSRFDGAPTSIQFYGGDESWWWRIWNFSSGVGGASRMYIFLTVIQNVWWAHNSRGSRSSSIKWFIESLLTKNSTISLKGVIQRLSGVNNNIKGMVHQTLYMCVMMVAYLSGDLLLLCGKFNFSF